jgi:hypothetical protein
VSQPPDQTPSKRQYPPVYEKIVPIAMALIAGAIILMIIVAIGVALGLFS